MYVLGIETSCDETAVAVVNEKREILLNEIFSQIPIHQQYGGVVPEIAARNHMLSLPKMIHDSIRSGKIDLCNVDAVAVTQGPGLIGGLIVGVMIAKGIASVLKKPCIPINHLEGHALIPRLTNTELQFPYLLLLVSGGHCQLLLVRGVAKYTLLGETLDDAVGESFDKVAKMLGLPYPGGPIVEEMARNGRADAIKLPKAFFGKKHLNFSFSGLKTAVMRHVLKQGNEEGNGHHLTIQKKADICASFQYTVAEILSDRLEKALQYVISNIRPSAKGKECDKFIDDPNIKHVVVSGGVAANQFILNKLRQTVEKYSLELIAPPIRLCTDNGVMIAWAGVETLQTRQNVHSLDFAPISRFSL